MGNPQEVCELILSRVVCRMEERYVWLKINEEQEVMECLSVEYWLALQDERFERTKEIVQLVGMLNFRARDIFFNYANDLAFKFMKEEWERYEQERKVL